MINKRTEILYDFSEVTKPITKGGWLEFRFIVFYLETLPERKMCPSFHYDKAKDDLANTFNYVYLWGALKCLKI